MGLFVCNKTGADRRLEAIARDFATKFYNSARWKKARQAAMKEHYWLCQVCAKPAKIVHHIRHITPENIDNDDITLNLNNLMCLCQDCHNRIHESAGSVRSGLMFDASGQIVEVATTSKQQPPY